MKWSWRLGQVAGITIYIHSTFLILLGWVAIVYYQEHHRLADALSGLLFIVCLFGIVVLHELGHALTAKRFGIRTRDITLLPIGGIARLERMPEDPGQELLVALAGPAVNVALAVLLFLVLLPIGGLAAWSKAAATGGLFLARLLWINISLAIFNLLPAFPMDGGRVLRAILAMRLGYVRATQIAASIGQGMALLFGFIGLSVSPLLVFIALFVWLGAEEEAKIVQIKAALGGVPVRRVMITDMHVLSPEDRLSRAIEAILSGFQLDFPVVEDGRLVGMLMHSDILTALAKSGDQVRVAEVMQREFETAGPTEMLDGVLTRLLNDRCRSMPVLNGGRLAGMVTLDQLGELLMIQSALNTQHNRMMPV